MYVKKVNLKAKKYAIVIKLIHVCECRVYIKMVDLYIDMYILYVICIYIYMRLRNILVYKYIHIDTYVCRNFMVGILCV